MEDYQLSLLMGIILELFGIISLLLNIFSIGGMFHGDYLKQSAACVFFTAIITNAIFSLLFVAIIGPTLIFGKFIFPEIIYTFLDVFGVACWNLGGLLSATMAIERLAVLVLPQFSLIFKNGPLLGVIGLQILYSFTSGAAICRQEMSIINIDSFILSFPREFNYGSHSLCATVGLGIDFSVTLICLVCYLMVYFKLKKMNNASGCLLSERAKYKRKQKEIKVAIDFFISSLVYIVFWVTARLVKPFIPQTSSNRSIFAALLLLQIANASIIAFTSILFFKEVSARQKHSTKEFIKKLQFREKCIQAFHHPHPVAPIPTINQTPPSP